MVTYCFLGQSPLWSPLFWYGRLFILGACVGTFYRVTRSATVTLSEYQIVVGRQEEEQKLVLFASASFSCLPHLPCVVGFLPCVAVL